MILFNKKSDQKHIFFHFIPQVSLIDQQSEVEGVCLISTQIHHMAHAIHTRILNLVILRNVACYINFYNKSICVTIINQKQMQLSIPH